MKISTQKQIEALKQQTIGVEIEMNNIQRSAAATIAADYFGTHRFSDTHIVNGYYSWTAWDSQGREWKFQRDVSISGPDSQKCEMVTPVLHYEDIEMLQGLVRALRKAGAKSDPTRGCGVHIHIGADGHTPQSLRNLVNIMAAHESQLIKAIKIDRSRINYYCKTVDPKFLAQINSKKPKTMSQLKDIWYRSQSANFGIEQHYNPSRYHMLNYHAVFTKGTIEFRLFQFSAPEGNKQNGLHAGELKAYIQLCLAMSQLAKQVKYASPKPQQTENEAYAFRCWMLRLGFIGDEFKTARTILLRNMEGNCAWRNADEPHPHSSATRGTESLVLA